MKTSEEFFERLKNDKDFADRIREAIFAKKREGATNGFEVLISVAAVEGYELTKEEIDGLADSQGEDISEEELGKIAGGWPCVMASALVLVTALISVSKSVEHFD